MTRYSIESKDRIIVRLRFFAFAKNMSTIFLCIIASAADAATVNHNGIKALLANG